MKNNKTLFLLSAALLLAFIIYYPDAAYLWKEWMSSEEYSHGPLMLLIALTLALNRKPLLQAPQDSLKWQGALLVIVGSLLYAIAIKANIETLRQFAFLFIMLGLFLSAGGKNYGRFIAPSLLLVALVLPIPNIFVSNLSSGLRLFSTDISVQLLRLSGVSVFQEGNIIDLGKMKLEVADACSGLRYLFPMIGIGVLSAMIFDIGVFKRLIIIVFAAAISIITNIIRIFITGTLIDTVSLEVSQGFFHLLEGWLYFLVALFLLGGFIYFLLNKRERSTFGRGAFHIENRIVRLSEGSNTIQIIATISILLIFIPASHLIRSIEPVIPERMEFNRFPLSISKWGAVSKNLPSIEQEILKHPDYFLGDYRSGTDPYITLFMSYYADQKKSSFHSPQVCIPGGGWVIESSDKTIVRHEDRQFPVNRLVIKKGAEKQLVYYWFQQKGRHIANESLSGLNWKLTSLLYSRTDVAFVRLNTPMEKGSDNSTADIRLTEFTQALIDELSPFLPNPA